MNFAVVGLRHSHIFAVADEISKTAGCAVLGAFEANPEARKAAEAAYKFKKYYAAYEELLADSSVAAVAVGDCFGLRGQRVIAALKAGKHVLCDKPICTRLSELEEIRKLCDEKQLKLGCMLTLRHDPALRTAAEIISSGSLGEVKSVNFTGQHPLMYGSRPMWYFEKDMHGGTINDIAIHGFDALGFMTGCEYTETLYAHCWNSFAAEHTDFSDCAQLLGRLSNGAGVMADVSYSAPNGTGYVLPTYWRFDIFCEEGFIECTLGKDSILVSTRSELKTLPVKPHAGSCILDFIQDAAPFDTGSVLKASEIALKAQASAALQTP